MKSKWFWFVCLLLSVYLSIFALQKINLASADLGRHIENGYMFFKGHDFGITKWSLLHTNLYSSTNSDFPFVNHHYGSGIIFYIVYILSGWNGLSIFYLLCLIFTLTLLISAVRKNTDIVTLSLTSIFIIPLLADRVEIRPEGISYLFIAIFIFILYRFSKDEISPKWLWLIPFMEILWVNIHIYFILGLCLIGAFFVQFLIQRNLNGAKHLSKVFAVSAVATIINPFGVKLALYPLNIFKNYGYMIVENQSVPFLEKISFQNPSFLWFKISVIISIISTAYILVRQRKSFEWALFFTSLSFGVMAFLAIRYIPLFAIASLLLLSVNFSIILKDWKMWNIPRIRYPFGSIFLIIFLIITLTHFKSRLNSNYFGIGLLPQEESSAEFIKQNNIKGPFFNNYDIGGYFIFNFFPKEKPFVDNRPEAYPSNFFTDIYVPMQDDETVWQSLSVKHNFNAIYFYRLDMTPWAQKFLIERVKDPLWSPIYVDNFTIILVRQNDQNKDLISKFALPQSIFSIK